MTPDPKTTLEEFGKLLIRDAYDQTIDVLHTLLSRGLRGARKDELHLAYESLDERTQKLVRQLMQKAVDQMFAHCLNFFDAHEIPIAFSLPDGSEFDVTHVSDGLATEPFTELGWIAKFSKFANGIEPLD